MSTVWMDDVWTSAAVFVCLVGASIGAMYIWPILPARHRDDDTNAVVRLIANIFVMMTSLVFGLMVNSARTTYADIDGKVHAFATNLIILDRTLRTSGIAGVDARLKLAAYVGEAIAHPARIDDSVGGADDSASRALGGLGDTLAAIRPADSYHEALLIDARQQYRHLVEQHWTIAEQSEGAIPGPIIVMLTAWLMLIFASFGYRAPRHEVVVASFVISALLIAGAFYLVLDMNIPFAGTIQISDTPLRRALAEMRL